MNKCDFCAYSSPNGECYWTGKANRIPFCKRAIELMVKTLGKSRKGGEG
jgi:hypothetical protein